jgi:hypothetical protein
MARSKRKKIVKRQKINVRHKKQRERAKAAAHAGKKKASETLIQ